MLMRTPRRRAFTLIELLVVMSVIAILMSLLVPTLHAIRRQVNEARCEGMIQGLSMAIEAYKQRYYVYPPDSHTELSYVSEALIYYLSGASIAWSDPKPSGYPWGHVVFKDNGGSGRKASHIFYQFKDDILQDIDTKNGVPAIIDPWLRPLFYNAPGGANANPNHNVQGFDLVSAGVDGNLGTDDDLGNYSDSNPDYSNSGVGTTWKPNP
jgi:prepilin-type N-terminal cleavage/methylation domain-containing protein